MFRVVFVAAVVMGAVLTTAAPAKADTAAFTRTAEWGGGYEGRYTITNTSPTTMATWAVAFDAPAGTTVGAYWDALLTQSGNRYTFRNREYNGALAPGATASFGWVSAGTGSASTTTTANIPQVPYEFSRIFAPYNG